MSKMSDYEFLSRVHNYSELHNIFGKHINELDIVRFLRSKGVDIRVHETNRTIPKKHFRVCYPFTIPSWQPIYTKWVDIGEHMTGDLDIEELLAAHN